jgi:DNA (cytosine-5)-methyltransferase 1
MNELALFAGAGGGILGGKLLGWRTVCAVEWEPYPASVLCARQNDGLLPPFPIWDDVQTFDGKPWRGIVDVVSGGFPCQDISAAGKGAGIDGERSGMWSHMARVVGEVRPRFVFVENSPMLVTRGLERVLGDLTALGYDTKWIVMGAADVGANHQRDRIWIVGKLAHTRCKLRKTWDRTRMDSKTQIGSTSTVHNQSSCERQNVSNSNLSQRKGGGLSSRVHQEHTYACNSRWWQTEPNVGRMVNGLASGVDRLKAIGNGQVPLCAATAWRLLTA